MEAWRGGCLTPRSLQPRAHTLTRTAHTRAHTHTLTTSQPSPLDKPVTNYQSFIHLTYLWLSNKHPSKDRNPFRKNQNRAINQGPIRTGNKSVCMRVDVILLRRLRRSSAKRSRMTPCACVCRLRAPVRLLNLLRQAYSTLVAVRQFSGLVLRRL